MDISPIIIWFVVGLVLILMEFIIPGLVIVFFGLGAWIAAIFVSIFPEMAFWVQMMIFTVFSVGALVLLRRTLKKRFFSNQEGAESEGLDDYIGQTAVVEKAIKNGCFNNIRSPFGGGQAFTCKTGYIVTGFC